ncbi:Acetolactate synthase-like protein [Paramyrothecium foliicola]|nr:Acetolactate synthase-like protein [Paramyrothecium foliicola]
MASQGLSPSPATNTFTPALDPPPGVTSNPDNPESLAPIASITIAICIPLVTIFFALRCYVRLFVKRTWIFEDYLVTLGWAGVVSYCGIMRGTMSHHGGKHGWDITKEESREAAFWFNAAAIHYGVMIAIAKLAVLWLYRRVFSPRRHSVFDIAIITLIVMTIGFYGITTFVKIFECSPRDRIWNKAVPGKCIQMKWVLNISGGFNTATDFIIMLLPVHAVWKLQIDPKRKGLVILAFTFGLCAPIFATIGFVVRIKNSGNPDKTWKQPEILLWGAAELASGNLCVCFPELAVLFRKHFRKNNTGQRRPTASEIASANKVWDSKQAQKGQYPYLPKSLMSTTFSVNGDSRYIELQDQGNNIHVTSIGTFPHDPKLEKGVVIMKNEPAALQMASRIRLAGAMRRHSSVRSATTTRRFLSPFRPLPPVSSSLRCSSSKVRAGLTAMASTSQRLPSLARSNHQVAGPGGYTTAYALFEGLWEAGITTCFVNVGSDHPSVIEAIVKGKRERPDSWPRMITCPSEVTAISMADGYARVTGKPQAVLVHVDVGTQALGQGVHNASIGRAPVFIFAGLCPYTESGELPGSRTEYMHWLQEPPDQKAIVRQYCRYTGEVRTGLNIKQTIGRALQFASSTPKGPVYIAGAREVLAENIPPYSLDQDQWVPIGPSALTADAVHQVAEALVQAKRPLIITGYSGRDRRTPGLLVELANLIPGIRVHDTGGSDVCFPASHPASEGFRLSSDECNKDADVIFLLDCDVPWIPARNPPPKDAKIYHVDCDPLNQHIPVSFFPAHGRWKADSHAALKQLVDHIKTNKSLATTLQDPEYEARRQAQIQAHKKRLDGIAAQVRLADNEALDANNVARLLKESLPPSATFVVEAVTASLAMHDQIQPDRPGSWINCGGTGVGWSNGAALGVKMALSDLEKHGDKPSLVCHIVGDGSFMCAAPSTALWVASKYKIPVLTIVLNNGGWKAPRNSTRLVYPNGLNATATDEEVNVSFRPTPNYAALAEAAAGAEIELGDMTESKQDWMKGVRVRNVKELKEALQLATSRVGEQGKGMLIETLMQ